VRGAVLSSHGSSLVPAGMRRILAEVAALRGVELIVSTPAMRNNRSADGASGRYDVCAGIRTRDEALHRRAGWPACHEKQQTCISW
jgi:deoxyhypusine synthase